MRRFSGESSCWGYLLPISCNLPPLEICSNRVTVGCDPSCDLVVNAKDLGCKKDALSKQHFTIVFSPHDALLQNTSKQKTYVNDEVVENGRQIELFHNAVIAISQQNNKVFTFVRIATSDARNHVKELKNKYVIAHQIGGGAFGRVFLVINKKKRERAAMKVIDHNIFTERETTIIQKLNHPCIIHTYNVFNSKESAYLVMEYMNGGDLSKLVNSKKLLNESQMKLIFYQLTLAVQYLHTNLIGHRDLKIQRPASFGLISIPSAMPANILLKDDKPHTLIKLTDFGLAKDEHLHSEMTTRAGTENFVAPEVGKSTHYSKEVDIWSMGVILFFGLSGRLPFHSRAEAKQAFHQVMFDRKQWFGVSTPALTLVKEMLEPAPERRIRINKILASQWFEDTQMKDAADALMGKVIPVRKHSAPPLGSQQHVTQSDRRNSVPAAANNLRERIPPRGVLQYMGSTPAQDQSDQQGFFRKYFSCMGNKQRRTTQNK